MKEKRERKCFKNDPCSHSHNPVPPVLFFLRFFTLKGCIVMNIENQEITSIKKRTSEEETEKTIEDEANHVAKKSKVIQGNQQ